MDGRRRKLETNMFSKPREKTLLQTSAPGGRLLYTGGDLSFLHRGDPTKPGRIDKTNRGNDVVTWFPRPPPLCNNHPAPGPKVGNVNLLFVILYIII